MILYLDIVSGISGDMALGGLVDLGVSPEWLARKLAPVLDGFALRTEIVYPSHLRAVSLYVDVTDQTSHRTYRDIKDIINRADLPETVRKNSLAAFEKIAAAESRIHGKDMETVHFHEIGGVDSLVDIIGTFLAVEHLGVTRVAASPVPLGSGFVDCAHGRIPVPVPATLAVLTDIPVIGSDAKTEIVTPTGAAIVATLAGSFGPMPPMEITATGYGAGKRETGSSAPNVLRMVLGRPRVEAGNGTGAGGPSHILRDRVMVLTTNVDDMSPELLGFAMERLMDRGALDVSFAPVTMKKNRPGVRMEVICKEADAAALGELVFKETSALGIRCRPCDRMILKREDRTVEIDSETGSETGLGPIRVKAVTGPDGREELVPEYEACREKALELGLPLKRVYDQVRSLVNPLDREKGRLYKTKEPESEPQTETQTGV